RVVLKARCFCNFITKGTTPSKNELLETGDVPFLKVYNIVNNELDFDYRPIFISNEVHTSKLKRSIAHPGDV
ncbi:restriction endonuclease subunit S, partial [Vibrio parahaemolyticus]